MYKKFSKTEEIIKKLKLEGRISKTENPIPHEEYEKINYKIRSFNKQNYEALQNSKRLPYF